MRQQIGDVTLIHGDCLDVMPTLRAGSVSLVFADLPYSVTSCVWDTPICLTSFWAAVSRVVREQGVVSATAVIAFACALLQNPKVKFRHDLVWHKTRRTGFFQAKRAPLRAHEHILVFANGSYTYNPQMVVTNNTRRESFVGKSRRSEYVNITHKPLSYTYTDQRFPVSVLQVESPASERGLHPTQKPVALLEWLIRTYTNDGDTILDPVAGSASTAIAAMRVGNRKVICIEKDPVYFEAMVKRVTAEHAKVVA